MEEKKPQVISWGFLKRISEINYYGAGASPPVLQTS